MRRKANEHKIPKGKHGSRTAGKDKGDSCKTWVEKKYHASNPKARKSKQYGYWNQVFMRINQGSGMSEERRHK